MTMTMTTTTTLTVVDDGWDPIVAVYAEDLEITADLLEQVARWLNTAGPDLVADLARFAGPCTITPAGLASQLAARADLLHRLATKGIEE